MNKLKRMLIAATVGIAGMLLVSGVLFSYRVQAACVNPSPLPSGYAAPCPVFSLSASTVPQSGTLTLTATPQAGTDYVYTTAYVYNGTAWQSYTLAGNNVYPSYSSAQASLTLSSAQLSSLSLGTHYAVAWDWLWDSSAQCYKGPGLNQCSTGQWRVQEFTLTSPVTPTPTPTVLPTPTPTPSPTPIPTPSPSITPSPTPNPSCAYNASPSNFASQIAAAQPGQTVCLAAGNYGTFTGLAKAAPGVTITPAVGVTQASVTMTLDFRTPSPAIAWLIFNNITIPGFLLAGPTHDVTIKNSHFPSETFVDVGPNNNICGSCPAMMNSNIVFDNDVWDTSGQASGQEGRLEFSEDDGNRNGPNAGITVKNSTFSGGCYDGIQFQGNAGNGITIGPGNVLFNLLESNCGASPPHVDGIQFVGSGASGPIITGNYFHDDTTGVVQNDGSAGGNPTVANNVFQRIDNTQPSINAAGWGSASLVQHNTIVSSARPQCGFTHDLAGCSAIIKDNISSGWGPGGTVSGGSTGTAPTFFDYNLCTAGSCAISDALPSPIPAGPHSLSCTPTFVGGSTPTTYAGFALTAGSCGRNAGSDGKNVGAIP